MSLTLAAAAREYLRHPSPRAILAVLALCLGLRLGTGGFGGGDLLLLGGLLLYWPFMEWAVHVYVLHSRPRGWFGRGLYRLFGARHRQHHQGPADVELTFLPLRGIVASLLGYAALALLLPSWSLRLTAIAGVCLLGLFYEWTHFLCHVPYRPRTRWFRRARKLHRLHHYKNENYWFGVSMHLGDRVFGTLPAPEAVAESPRCRTL